MYKGTLKKLMKIIHKLSHDQDVNWDVMRAKALDDLLSAHANIEELSEKKGDIKWEGEKI
jgi:hypothetical protein